MPPTASGSDLIHAKIIKNLETADLVLCDMSALNPNVFFEFGMRTALNKPALDDATTRRCDCADFGVPIDLGRNDIGLTVI